MSNDAGPFVRAPLKERVIAILTFGHWFSRRSTGRGEKRASRTSGINARSSEPSTTARRVSSGPGSLKGGRFCSRKNSKKERQHPLQQQQQPPKITSLTAPVKISHCDPPPSVHTRRGSCSVPYGAGTSPRTSLSGEFPKGVANLKAARSKSVNGVGLARNSSVAGSRHSGTRSGELRKDGGGASMRRSSSKLSRLRDQYVKVMMKLGDLSSDKFMGHSVNFESQVFESEVIRKRSQIDDEIMNYYLNSGIQPGEWKDAQMDTRALGATRNSV